MVVVRRCVQQCEADAGSPVEESECIAEAVAVVGAACRQGLPFETGRRAKPSRFVAKARRQPKDCRPAKSATAHGVACEVWVRRRAKSVPELCLCARIPQGGPNKAQPGQRHSRSTVTPTEHEPRALRLESLSKIRPVAGTPGLGVEGIGSSRRTIKAMFAEARIAAGSLLEKVDCRPPRSVAPGGPVGRQRVRGGKLS